MNLIKHVPETWQHVQRFIQERTRLPERVQEIFRERTLEKDKLLEHMIATYFNLRLCTGLLALVFPFLLWLGGLYFGDERITLLDSMSAYYHTDMWGIFVGVLVVVGMVLILYRGYTDFENYVLNLAGLLVWGVALLPADVPKDLLMESPEKVEAFTAPTAHGVFAICFFVSIAYVCIWRSRDTLKYITDKVKQDRYTWLYLTLGVLMIVLPLLAALLLKLLGEVSLVFWVEFIAVWVFGLFWIAKSFEVRDSALPGFPKRKGGSGTGRAAQQPSIG